MPERTFTEFSEDFGNFLKNFGLYRKYNCDSMTIIHTLMSTAAGSPRITMSMTWFCEKCKKDERMFKYTANPRAIPLHSEPPNLLIHVKCRCVECEKQVVNFIVYVNFEKNYLMKVGQWPSWLPRIDQNLEKALGDNLEIYKKGLYCENEGCGIGAFAYYRRVVENTIDGLLDDLLEAIKADDAIESGKKSLYETAYRQAKDTVDTARKIECAIEMVPQDLIDGIGTNPLKMLHSALSIGLHSAPDEKCLHSAQEVRTALNHFVKGISEERNRTQERKEKIKYSDALKKLERNFI